MANTAELLPHAPVDAPLHQRKVTLDKNHSGAALDLRKAYDGEIICTIYCEGGNKYEVLFLKAGGLLVANSQKQLGEHNALYSVTDGSEVFIKPDGTFVGSRDKLAESGDFLVRIANTTVNLPDQKRQLTQIETNPNRKNVVFSEHIIET